MIDYRLRLHGLPIRWQSKISNWDPPSHFVDEQTKGPYQCWHHLHTFEDADGGTLVRDTVHYALMLGFILHPLLVRRDLSKIFEFRREILDAGGRREPTVSVSRGSFEGFAFCASADDGQRILNRDRVALEARPIEEVALVLDGFA